MFSFTDDHYLLLMRAIHDELHDLEELRALMASKGYQQNETMFRAMFIRTRHGTLWERFWKRVEFTTSEESCWLWKGSDGIKIGNSAPLSQHRIVWEMVHGTICGPTSGPDRLWVLHKCDNRKCVNPKHLFLGTALDNTRDMIAKGRHPSNWTMMNDAYREEARQLLRQGQTVKDVAKRFHVSERTIRTLARGPIERALRREKERESNRNAKSLFKHPISTREHLSNVMKRKHALKKEAYFKQREEEWLAEFRLKLEREKKA